MTIICPNCQTANDESHRFCSNCATPLARPASVPPPAPQPVAPPPVADAAPPPPPAPPAQVPWAPAGPPPAPIATAPGGWTATPQTVRLSPLMIVGGVVGVLVIVVLIGILIGTLLKPGNDTGGTTPTPTPTLRPNSNPTPTPTFGGFSVSTATPGQQTSLPSAQPATPEPGGGGSTGATQTIDVANIAITIPADWTVAKQEAENLDIRRAGGGQLLLTSLVAKEGTTVQGVIDNLYAKLLANHPDIKYCVPVMDGGPFNGPPGKTLQFCYTATSQSGNTYVAQDSMDIAIDSANNLYLARMYANSTVNKDALTDFFDAMQSSLRWKLYQGQ